MGQGFLGHPGLEPRKPGPIPLGGLSIGPGGKGGGERLGSHGRASSRTFSPKLGPMARCPGETDTQWTSQTRAGGSCLHGSCTSTASPQSVTHSLSKH